MGPSSLTVSEYFISHRATSFHKIIYFARIMSIYTLVPISHHLRTS